jgi:hypothetical protein
MTTDAKQLQDDLDLAFSLCRYRDWDANVLALNLGRCSGTICRLVERVKQLEAEQSLKVFTEPHRRPNG